MNPSELAAHVPSAEVGASMYELMADLFPLCRSITGAGLRDTLDRIGKILPLQISEVPTGTQAFDWTVPKEWNIRDAWVANARGERVIDFRTSNLHVVNYSPPVRRRLSLDELRPHLHTLPDHPTWVPYRTSYYVETWGFCLSQDALDRLPDGEYEAVIDATLEDGSLTYGECVLPGTSAEEILISSHVCHPSLANDNLSGVVVATYLARVLAQTERRYTYRFLFAPGTIGAIIWLAATKTFSTGSEPGWCWRVSVMTDLSSTSGAGGATPKWIEPPLMSFVAAGWAMRSSTSPRTATTSASSAHPASTCRSGPSPARATTDQSATTPRRTTWRRSTRPRWPTRSVCAWPSSLSSRTTPRSSAATPRANRSSAGAACTDPSAAGPTRRCSSRPCCG